ncbi:MAG: DUF1997 domain-containing protein [Cyanobacteria bacterium P01_F01_bin.4]
MVRFCASQSVSIEVPTFSVPIERYFNQTERLVYALVEPSQVTVLEEDIFRLRMRSLRFMMLALEPVTDIRVWLCQGRVMIQSQGCYLSGHESLNNRFSLDLQGVLEPLTSAGETTLSGQANLQVRVDLPAAFRLTPKSILETTGNGILNGVLLTIKQRLLHRLVADYEIWATQPLSVSSMGQ